ncbi:MAG TPA: iron chelate uptake ABC transporter family permease subunit, partial [Gemmatimonadaceae bacterium]|nr:iron chelate uptake ABC transporter family permease subunit [Gemmatimonadaceae bacterium]
MRRTLFWAAVPALLLLLIGVAVGVGAIPLSVADVARALVGEGDPTAVAIIRTLRLPRALLAALVGAGLGMAGAALQGSLRNPLAEPYLLGVSGGAAVGAVLAVAAGIGAAALLP